MKPRHSLFFTGALSIFLLAFQAAAQVADFTYTTNAGAITVESYTGPGGAATIPSMVSGLPVTRIDDYSLEFANFTSVVVPSGVTYIGDSAFFGCESMTSITLPSTVTTMVQNSLSACTVLKSVSIPSGVTAITEDMFSGDGALTTVTLAGNVTSIGDEAFYDCGQLTALTIPATCTSIGTSAFESCASLTSMVIPTNVATLGPSAFEYCQGLVTVQIPAKITSLGNFTFAGCTSAKGFYFAGNPPVAGTALFQSDTNATVYYTASSTGWGTNYAGLPARVGTIGLPGNSLAMSAPGVHGGVFGFMIAGTNDATVIIYASTNLTQAFAPILTNTLSGTNYNYTDAKWTNFARRYYRIGPGS